MSNITITGTPPEWKRHQRRAKCIHCGSELWTADGAMPLDHDRPDGRVCGKIRSASRYVSSETAYGRTASLSFAIRCF
jgi:hypothetical protein